MIKLAIYLTLVAVAMAASPAVDFGGLFNKLPTRRPPPPPKIPPPVAPTYKPSQPLKQIETLRSDSDIAPDGHYQYSYETENGIAIQERGELVGSGPDAALGVSGSYKYTAPDGLPVAVDYVAGADGYQPSGNVLPTSPPVPEPILRSIAYNEAHPES